MLARLRLLMTGNLRLLTCHVSLHVTQISGFGSYVIKNTAQTQTCCLKIRKFRFCFGRRHREC